LQCDIRDIEDLAQNSGGVMHNGLAGQQPVAVYKDEKGKAHELSAVCPHMKV
jgi:nitrite reductase/ring-hydroxylating ferredoxin subunit